MACEACNAKFSLFKRKRQCMDCLRYFCIECLIKRGNKMFSCDNCSMLSRRPLVRSQVAQMRTRDLRQYLLAKKVSIRGCVEKDELVTSLLLFANGVDDRANIYDRPNATAHGYTHNARSESRLSSDENVRTGPDDPTERCRSSGADFIADIRPNEQENLPDVIEESVSPTENGGSGNQQGESETAAGRVNNIEIEEVSGSDCSPTGGPEPLITEQEDVTETLEVQTSAACAPISTRSTIIKLSDINESSELECLTIKQLKILLSTNRVDFKGCIERHELLIRASRLWEEHKQSRTDVEALDEEDFCKICWDAPIECVILECGHMVCCISCGKRISECPICKQYVVRVVRFFKS